MILTVVDLYSHVFSCFMTFLSRYSRVCASAVILITLWLGGVGCSLCCASSDQDSCCLREEKSNSGGSIFSDNSSCDTRSSCSCCRSQTAQRQRQNDAAITNDAIVGCSLLPNRIEA